MVSLDRIGPGKTGLNRFDVIGACTINQSTESAESRKLLEQHNLLNGVGMLDTFDPHHQVKTDRRVTFMLC